MSLSVIPADKVSSSAVKVNMVVGREDPPGITVLASLSSSKKGCRQAYKREDVINYIITSIALCSKPQWLCSGCQECKTTLFSPCPRHLLAL
jgi:hypothetical protein